VFDILPNVPLVLTTVMTRMSVSYAQEVVLNVTPMVNAPETAVIDVMIASPLQHDA
jgi:hypothetical protein